MRLLHRALTSLASCFLLAQAGAALASDIGVTPVAVHLDKANDRATVNVNNSGTDPVIMQVEAIAWHHEGGVDEDLPTGDMVINPSVFTVQPGKSQLVRIGLRRAAQADHEGTYRIVLREVPAAPRPGEVRISGQVTVLMALRVPIYVAPVNVVRNLNWQATQAADGTVTASLRNDGNVHVRVGKIQLKSGDNGAVQGDHPMAAVVFPGEARSFKLSAARPDSVAAGTSVATLEVSTDQGVQIVPVALAQR